MNRKLMKLKDHFRRANLSLEKTGKVIKAAMNLNENLHHKRMN